MVRCICFALLLLPTIASAASISIDDFDDAETTVRSSAKTKAVVISQFDVSAMGGKREVMFGSLGRFRGNDPHITVAVESGALVVDSDYFAEVFFLQYGDEALDLDTRGKTFEAAFNYYLPEDAATGHSACFIAESRHEFNYLLSAKCVPIAPSKAPFSVFIPASELIASQDPGAADLSSVDRITFSMKAEPGTLSINSLRIVPEPSSLGVLPILALIRRRLRRS